jgi:hypothetical protein
MNDYFMDIATQASDSAKDKGINNIDPKWLYSQFTHESNDFTSQLTVENHNIGGVTQSQPNDSPQPDGNCYYINFASFEDYAVYFGHYLHGFIDSGVDQATTLEEYITALKNSPSGAYFGDSLENYITDCQRIYNENFGGDNQ